MQYTDPSGKCIGVLGGADTLFCAAVVGAVIGGLIDYGSQVYQNYQGGYRGWGTFTHVCIDELLISMAGGAVGGFVGYALGPLTAVITKSGLLGSIIAGAFEGGVAGGFTQIGGNLLSSKAWNTDLASGTIGGGIGGGVGGGLGWAAKGVVRAASSAEMLLIREVREEGGIANQLIPGRLSNEDFIRHQRALKQIGVEIKFNAKENVFSPFKKRISLIHAKDSIPRGVFFEEMQHALDWQAGNRWSLPHPDTSAYPGANMRVHIGTFDRMAANQKRFGLSDEEVQGLLFQVADWVRSLQ